MRNKIILLIISALILISCGEKSKKENYSEIPEKLKVDSIEIVQEIKTESKVTPIPKEIVSEENISKECKCYDGIGSSDKDAPSLTFNFSNSKSVSICGYKNPESEKDQLLISEFNIFDCSNGKQLVEYGAMDNCLIKTGQDLVQIELLKYLPIGENWEWKLTKVALQTITPDLSKLKVSELLPSYSKTQIKDSLQTAFLDGLKRHQGFGENWEENISKLEVLSLNGNDHAWEILKNYEQFTGEKTDGALAEMWKESKASVEWLTDKK